MVVAAPSPARAAAGTQNSAYRLTAALSIQASRPEYDDGTTETQSAQRN
jgi:hypothetical protein